MPEKERVFLVTYRELCMLLHALEDSLELLHEEHAQAEKGEIPTPLDEIEYAIQDERNLKAKVLEVIEPSIRRGPFDDLAGIANNAGAQGVWLIRGATAASLVYTPAEEIRQPDTSGAMALVAMNLTLKLDIADAGVLVLMRFPADGKESGIEVR